MNNTEKTRMPQNLFDALAHYDLEGMVSLYALHCRNVLQSVSRFNKDVGYRSLWNLRTEDTASKDVTGYEENLSRAIQEMDQIASNISRSNIVTTNFPSTKNLNEANTNTRGANVATFRSRPLESSSKGGHISNTNLLPFFPTLLDEPRFMPSPVSKITPNSGHRSRIRRLRSYSMEGSTARPVNVLDEEVEYCLRERMRALTNARPFSTLVVYKDGKPHTQKDDDGSGTRNMRVDVNLNTTSLDDNAEDVPIFDGAVANATPPGMHGSGGGSGTILHLACAIDSPFALVLLLLMGGDASCRHTAFRRLMLHEAACSNSPECLKLLLDLGDLYHGEFQRQEKDEYMDIDMDRNSNTNITVASFVATGKDKMSSSAKQRGEKHFMKDIPSGPINTSVPLSTTSLIHMALSLARKIRRGEVEDLDAAEILLSHYPLSNANQRFIAVSCYVGSDDVNKTDGHGNTALHWAAFKNAQECASTLLSYDTDPNAVSANSGWTPLHDAAYSDSTETLALLLSHGANVNVRAFSGASPLCFAAQEDAPNATRLLLNAGADATVRCCDDQTQSGYHGNNNSVSNPINMAQHLHSHRFSGYTPLHYCAHYNSHHAGRVILEHHNRIMLPNNEKLLEIPDLNEKLPIHVAVARGSSDVLRELLHYGARVETGRSRSCSMSIHDDQSNTSSGTESPTVHHLPVSSASGTNDAMSVLHVISGDTHMMDESTSSSASTEETSPDRRGTVITPVSSPILRSMIPSEPVESPKPWNCISQRSIDECRTLIQEAESNWAPERHSIFHPRDRLAVIELLRVGKRLEQAGTGIFIDLWPLVLSFCGRGWFEPERHEHHHGSIYLPQDL